MSKIHHRVILIVFMLCAITISFSQADSGKITVNGLSFGYVEEGSGSTALLIHGSVSDYREWTDQMVPLSKHCRVIAYSRRYHWPNLQPGKDADASLELQTDDLAGIMKAMNITTAHVIGHSFGGAVAVNFARKYPKLVRSLVLAEPAVSGVLGGAPEDESVSKESQAIRAEMKDAFASGDSNKIVKTYADHVAPGDLDKATSGMRQMLLANVAAFQLDFTSRRTAFTCDDAKQIAVPVLIISGGRSPMGLQRIAERAATCIGTAKLVKIPEATHWMQHDQAEALQ